MADLAYTPQPSPHLAAPGMGTMHADAQSSDATPLPGPGARPWKVSTVDLGGACPTVLCGSDGLVQVLMTQRIGSGLTFLRPKVVVLDPASGAVLGELEIAKGALLGGVYAFLDSSDRMVLVDGTNTLMRIAHDPTGGSLWVEERLDLTRFLGRREGDQVVGLVPDWRGRVWVASGQGQVAVIDESTHSLHAIALGEGERIDNSISAAPEGVSVITSRAIYLLDAQPGQAPQVVWRREYDAGSARKPGQLAWGSGASPTFFGPGGSDYLMLSDNADEQEKLIVYRTATGEKVGEAGLFTPGASGTENSMIGVGSTVIGASTYGYPYPRYPENAGESVPKEAPFAPGLERWDVTDSGLVNVWKREDVYSAAVPRLSCPDGLVYTCERRPGVLGNGVKVHAVAIDAATGETTYEQELPGLVTVFGVDTLQMVGTISPGEVWWQGTIGGVIRISAA
ncbi:6-pyruvoyl tetrahydrobiopterin synthase [Corynebacterium mastitidis]|uniref:6-pyruvoyl tetrahydrobiopterin synthase n=1 Tax=Corynebacterium mastitidis TaxID=161890 RepID=UPI00254A2B94|nr:6-pyruvoyl tetrahydrobiopterin synthase [Corynebacterium mastitidis]MDK8450151.1 6-pyruvoyl tetrahydrobiopterin synthase [Corynebacterium mastitidis]